jgi:hypothetical protein
LVLAGTVGDASKCVSTRLQQGKKDENYIVKIRLGCRVLLLGDPKLFPLSLLEHGRNCNQNLLRSTKAPLSLFIKIFLHNTEIAEGHAMITEMSPSVWYICQIT